MKKQAGIIALVLFAFITLICATAVGDEDDVVFFGEFSGNETVNAEMTGFSGTPFIFFEKPFYASSTLPEELTTSSRFDYVFLCKPGQERDRQVPDAGELTFLSGDETLKDALCFSLFDRVRVGTRIGKDVQPGEARYRIRLKAGKLYYEAEFVFRLLSWDEYPLFEIRNPDMSGTAQKGEGPELMDSFGNVAEEYRSSQNNTNLYTAEQVTAMVIRDHSDEVLSSLLTDEQKQAAAGYKASEGFYDLYAIERNGGSGWYPQENLWHGMDFMTDAELFQFREEGEYLFSLRTNISNVDFNDLVIIRVLPYRLTGPTNLMPGESGTYSVQDDKPEAGRSFTLSAQGNGISFDEGTGVLTVAEDTPEGTAFTVSASSSDGKGDVSLSGKVTTGLLGGESFRLEKAEEGFSIPLPADTEKYEYGKGSCSSTDQSAPARIYIDYKVYNPLEEFAEDWQVADKYYNYKNLSGYPEYQEENAVLGDYHARIMAFRVNNAAGDYSAGCLLYARNNRIMEMMVYSVPQNGTGWDELPKVTLGDMRKLAELIEYDPGQASVTVADGMISLSAKEGTDVVTAGKKMIVTAAFANPEKVNRKAKNDTIEWSVSGMDGTDAPAGVSISSKGELATAKSNEVTKVEVKASSPVFHTSASFVVTIIPAATKISAEPAELWFYNGTDTSAEVKAVLEPDTVPLLGITWQEAKKGIVGITADPEKGTAVIRPLAAGKTTVQVKEPGGKNAKLTVNVVEPAADLELTVNGKAKPGSTVTVKETVLPKQAGNKTVEWKLDVGEDIATINKGKVRIAETAEEGTVITVTCTATGAPEPIVKTVQIEVGK